MTDLRKAAEMALEALETDPDQLHPAQWGQAVKALRQSLFPLRREWVGLTEDEAFACKGRDYFDTYKTIEAKLKEKNT